GTSIVCRRQLLAWAANNNGRKSHGRTSALASRSGTEVHLGDRTPHHLLARVFAGPRSGEADAGSRGQQLVAARAGRRRGLAGRPAAAARRPGRAGALVRATR